MSRGSREGGWRCVSITVITAEVNSSRNCSKPRGRAAETAVAAQVLQLPTSDAGRNVPLSP